MQRLSRTNSLYNSQCHTFDSRIQWVRNALNSLESLKEEKSNRSAIVKLNRKIKKSIINVLQRFEKDNEWHLLNEKINKKSNVSADESEEAGIKKDEARWIELLANRNDVIFQESIITVLLDAVNEENSKLSDDHKRQLIWILNTIARNHPELTYVPDLEINPELTYVPMLKLTIQANEKSIPHAYPYPRQENKTHYSLFKPDRPIVPSSPTESQRELLGAQRAKKPHNEPQLTSNDNEKEKEKEQSNYPFSFG